MEGASRALLNIFGGASGSDGTHFLDAFLERVVDAQRRLERLIDEETELDSYTIARAEEVNEQLLALIDDSKRSPRDFSQIAGHIKRVQTSTTEETIREAIENQIDDVKFGCFVYFKLSYGEVFPDEAERRRLLAQLENHSAGLPIVVDVGRERIYKLSPS